MPSKNAKAIAVYQFLTEAENQTFTLEEVAEISGWSLRTVNTYRSKKWHSFLRNVDSGYKCSGISKISEDVFFRIQGQRIHIEGMTHNYLTRLLKACTIHFAPF